MIAITNCLKNRNLEKISYINFPTQKYILPNYLPFRNFGILNLPLYREHITNKQLPRWGAWCLQVVTGSLYPVSIPLLPPAWGTRRNDPSIVTEGVINEGMTRRRGEISKLRTVLLVWELRKPRKRFSKARHLIASRQNTVGEPFTSCSTHTSCRHVTRGIRCIEGAGSSRFSRQNSGRWLYNVHYKINEGRMLKT